MTFYFNENENFTNTLDIVQILDKWEKDDLSNIIDIFIFIIFFGINQ